MSDPVTRQEQLLSAIATGGDIISPITREEMYLAYLAGDTSIALLEPITRKEQFLYQACLNGGSGGGGTEITDGIVVKARDADGYATEVDFYSGDGVVYPKQFVGSEKSNGIATAMRYLKKINLKNRITALKSGAFEKTFALEQIVGVDANPFEYVTSMDNRSWIGIFQHCACPLNLSLPNFSGDIPNQAHSFCNAATGLLSVSIPNATGELHQYAFSDCTALKTVYLPKITSLNADANSARGVFRGCTALETVEIGSVGYSVTILNNNFYGDTQTGLTITVYTTGAYADTALTNIRNGATNATIIIKDSMTGETIVTSTP